MENYNKIWRIFFAVSLIAIAVQQVLCGVFLPVIMPPWPWLVNCTVCIWLTSILIVIASVCIILKIKARPAAVGLGIIFLLLFVVFHVPYQVKTSLHHIGPWTNSFKMLAFSGGAFLAAASLTNRNIPDNDIYPKMDWLIPAGRIFFSITMIVFGIEHFLYTEFVAMLVPSWIPGPLFWTYLAGTALIAGGLGVILNIQLRLAANLLGVMIFLWLIMLHIPRAIADPHTAHGNELTSVFEAFGFSGIAFLIAGTAREKL